MKILNDKLNLNKFFESLKQTGRPILMLDYDGTLAPFVVERDEAVPYPGVREMLSKIAGARHTRMIIVTGRRAKELVNLLKLDNHPEIWGSHGMERLMPDGRYHQGELSLSETLGLKSATTWALHEGLKDIVEEKPAGLAFHWRGMKEKKANQIKEKIIQKWQPLQDEYHLKLLDFECGIELKAAGTDKGQAVKKILAESQASPEVAYLGDDLTDEDAFEALKKRGLTVLVREQYRETAADLWLTPPQEMLDFLERWHEARMHRKRK